MARKKKRPSKIELDNDTGQLRIEWTDDSTTLHSLVEMRRNCPCAVCRDARNPGSEDELRLLQGAASTATAVADGFVRVGRYGLRIVWADGHDTGIYTFDLLREGQSSAQV